LGGFFSAAESAVAAIKRVIMATPIVPISQQ
jgi:hypothetical protein